MRPIALLLQALTLGTALLTETHASDESSSFRESLDEAWWTGPLLAASPATLPHGHFLVEPYLYDAIIDGEYGSTGARHTVARQNDYGSLTYLLYGLTDSTTIGIIPRFGFNDPQQGLSSSAIEIGDMTAQIAYRLASFHDQGWLPALSLVVGETLPTGRYDRLGNRPSDGVGAGDYTTTVSLYSQYYLWMPNGRILRTRLDISQSWSKDIGLEDTSVYGTTQGFHGRARPGNSVTFDSAWEYSVTRNWVGALDVVYNDTGSTRLLGDYPQLNGGSSPVSVRNESGSSNSISFAPAIEYNWSSTAGIIVGAKFVAAGHNTSSAIIPIVAVNLVF